MSPFSTPWRGGRKGRTFKGRVAMAPKSSLLPNSPPKEAFIYSEAQKIVQFHILDKSVKVSIADEIPCIPIELFAEMVEKGECPVIPEVPSEPHIKLPEASFTELKSYNICDAPPRPNA